MESESRMLNSVRPGMVVFDARGNRIGTVRTVFGGGLNDRQIETGAETADSPVVEAGGPDNLVEMFAQALGGDELPEELKQRLLNNGYVLMDADGILAADRLILPEQISSVGPNGLHLSSLRSGLPKM